MALNFFGITENKLLKLSFFSVIFTLPAGEEPQGKETEFLK
jgi:hypothetical protein